MHQAAPGSASSSTPTDPLAPCQTVRCQPRCDSCGHLTMASAAAVSCRQEGGPGCTRPPNTGQSKRPIAAPRPTASPCRCHLGLLVDGRARCAVEVARDDREQRLRRLPPLARRRSPRSWRRRGVRRLRRQLCRAVQQRADLRARAGRATGAPRQAWGAGGPDPHHSAGRSRPQTARALYMRACVLIPFKHEGAVRWPVHAARVIRMPQTEATRQALLR